jgi:DNA-binding CsgD family transcriptional regulator
LSPRRKETGWDRLSPAEQRVAQLVAAGMTYRQIGERLGISRRTVETHVAHAFTKLGIASRERLAEIARNEGRQSCA